MSSPVVARKPMLASEALMEDLAPVEPARSGVRAWCAGVGVGSLLVGVLPLVGLLPGRHAGGDPLAGHGRHRGRGRRPGTVTWGLRAVAMVVLGLLTGMVALQGAGGALMRVDGGAPWALARLIGAVALPAALLFRARYRAYAGARVFLGAALFLSLPFAVHTVLGLFGPVGLATVGAVAVLFALAGSFVGFMGAETTGAGTYLAPVTVVALALDILLRGLGHGPLLGVATGAVAFGGGSALGALGVFQIVAWRFAADARRIDFALSPARIEAAAAADRDTGLRLVDTGVSEVSAGGDGGPIARGPSAPRSPCSPRSSSARRRLPCSASGGASAPSPRLRSSMPGAAAFAGSRSP